MNSQIAKNLRVLIFEAVVVTGAIYAVGAGINRELTAAYWGSVGATALGVVQLPADAYKKDAIAPQ